MKNFIQPGDTLTLPAPRDILSGQGMLVGDIFGVASFDALSGVDVEAAVKGVFNLAKVGSQAWATKGLPIYWDNTNHYATTTALGNKRIGESMSVVGSGAGETTGYVRIRGTSGTASLGGLVAGERFARGSAAALDGSNPTPITTGLSTITAAGVSLRGTAAPGDNTSVLTCDYSGSDGVLNVYAWKNTGGTDPTLVASSGTETFDWWAVGA